MAPPDNWLSPTTPTQPVRSPSWMAPPATSSGDRASWNVRPRRADSVRPSMMPPPRGSVAPPSGGPRSVFPSAPPAPAAILDIDELVAPYLVELRAAVASSAASLQEARREALLASERGLVELAMAIAERVVGRELRIDPSLVSRWAHEGIAALHGEDAIALVASSDVAPHLDDALETSPNVTLEVDPLAVPGTCRLQGRWGRVDASLRARLDATFAALEPPDEEEPPGSRGAKEAP